MKKKTIAIVVAALIFCGAFSTLIGCNKDKKGATDATLNGLYVTGNEAATAFANSNYSVYNGAVTTKATDENQGILTAGDNAKWRVTKPKTSQTYESVFFKVSNWSRTDLQFAVTIKNNLATTLTVKIGVAVTDSATEDLSTGVVRNGDTKDGGQTFTLGGNATRTYRVTVDGDNLYDTLGVDLVDIKAVYIRLNTHGTNLEAVDATLSNATLKEPETVFDAGDFSALYGSNDHKVLTSQYNEANKILSSTLYLGASVYSRTNYGFDALTTAWNSTSERYLHYKIVNISEEGKTNMEEYGVSLFPVKGTGSSAAANTANVVNEGFTTSKQTITGTIDLKDIDFSTIRIHLNDRDGNEYNKPVTSDGIYVAVEIHIQYSANATPSFGTLPTLGYTLVDMPEPPPVPTGTGDLTGMEDIATAESTVDEVEIALVSRTIVGIDAQVNGKVVVNKLVVVIDYDFTAAWNGDESKFNGNKSDEFAGIILDFSDFDSDGLDYCYNYINAATSTGNIRVKSAVQTKNIDASTSEPYGRQTPGTNSGTRAGDPVLEPDTNGTRSGYLGYGNGQAYGNIGTLKIWLGATAAVSGRFTAEFWFGVNPPDRTLTAPTIAADTTDLTGRTIKWSAVADAVSYDVYLNDTKLAGNGSNLTYKLTKTEPADYKLKVMAIGNGSWLKNSALSNEITLDLKYATGATELTDPTLALDTADTDNRTVKWAAVTNAIAYNVYLGEGAGATEFELVSEFTSDLSYKVTKPQGDAEAKFVVKVIAIGDSKNHKHSPGTGANAKFVVTVPAKSGEAPDPVGTWNANGGTDTFTTENVTANSVTYTAIAKAGWKGGKLTLGSAFDYSKYAKIKFTVTSLTGSNDIAIQFKLAGASDNYVGPHTFAGGNGEYTLSLRAQTDTALEFNITAEVGAKFTLSYEFVANAPNAVGTFSVADTGSQSHFTQGAVTDNSVVLTCIQTTTQSSYKGGMLTLAEGFKSHSKIKFTVTSSVSTGNIQIQFKKLPDANYPSYSGYSGYKDFANGEGTFADFIIDADKMTDAKIEFQIVATVDAVFTISYEFVD